MKNCRKCGVLKPMGEYYLHRRMADGHLNVCKECTKTRVKRHRAANDNVRAYDRERAKLPHRMANTARVSREWREANPEAYKAHTAVGNAIRDGKLLKRPCVECGANDNLHAHHHDYAKPLDVTWYCALHHHRHHAAENAA